LAVAEESGVLDVSELRRSVPDVVLSRLLALIAVDNRQCENYRRGDRMALVIPSPVALIGDPVIVNISRPLEEAKWKAGYVDRVVYVLSSDPAWQYTVTLGRTAKNQKVRISCGDNRIRRATSEPR
jgi:hypothetical protein